MAEELVGINGFGRVGQMFLRMALERELRVVAINDPEVGVEQMASMLERDSSQGVSTKTYLSPLNQLLLCQGSWDGDVAVKGGRLFLNGKPVTVYKKSDISSIPWSKSGAKYIIETRAVGTERELRAHLSAGAYRVIVAAPIPELPLLIVGVNELEYKTDWKLVSAGCSTSTCLAPLVGLLNTKLGVAEVMVTAVRGATTDTSMVDTVSKVETGDWRAGRGFCQSITPLALGAEETISKVVPALEGKIGGLGIQVQTAAVSLLDITLKLEQDTDYEAVCAAVVKASEGSLHGVLGYTEQPLVSADFVGDQRSAVVDFPAGLQLGPGMVKLVVW